MHPTDVGSQVRQTAADVFAVPPASVDESSSPDTIQAWDSLKHLELVLALEQQFGITFDPEEIAEMLSLEIVIDFVRERLAG